MAYVAIYSKHFFKGHHTIREKVSQYDRCPFVLSSLEWRRQYTILRKSSLSHCPLNVEDMFQCISVSAVCDIQCYYGFVTFVCACVLAGNLLQRAGEQCWAEMCQIDVLSVLSGSLNKSVWFR